GELLRDELGAAAADREALPQRALARHVPDADRLPRDDPEGGRVRGLRRSGRLGGASGARRGDRPRRGPGARAGADAPPTDGRAHLAARRVPPLPAISPPTCICPWWPALSCSRSR